MSWPLPIADFVLVVQHSVREVFDTEAECFLG